MLIKKELLTMEPCKYQKLKASEYKKYAKYAEFAQEANLQRTGHVVEADFYERKTKKLRLRTFFDGKNVVSYFPVEDNWSDAKPSGCLGVDYWSSNQYVPSQSSQKVRKKLNSDKKRLAGDSLAEYLDDVVSEKGTQKRMRAWKRKNELFETLTAMLPDYPKRLPVYCEKNVFGYTYIFIGKIQHKKRTAVCAHCGAEFTVDKSIKPHQHGICPHCGEKAEYFADWVEPPHEKIRRIAICCKSRGDLIIRWATIKRYFSGHGTRYVFDDYFRDFYIHSGDKATVYAYRYTENMGYHGWSRLCNGSENTDATFIYLQNFHQVFGKGIYGVDLAEELRECRDEISITRMLDSLKYIPQAKYFLHKGLRRLSQSMWDPYETDKYYSGKTFAEVFGVRAQYFPLYKKYDVTMAEHKAIKACGEWVDEEMFLKLRKMKVNEYDIARYGGFLKNATTIKKSINYLYKQFMQYGDRDFYQLSDYWHDYLTMSAALKVDISNKQIKFPKNLIAAHDVLSVRSKAVKDKIQAEMAKKAFKTIYTGIPAYRTAKYLIAFPKSEVDFLREGQQLHHCVGNGTYFKRHIEGINMIFFIRKAEEPEKPFFTVEVNVEKRAIVQLYGYHDCKAPKEIWNFVEQFAKHIEPRGEITAEKERKSA